MTQKPNFKHSRLINRIIKEAGNTLEFLSTSYDELPGKITAKAEEIKAAQVNEKIASMSVDELGKAKLGIRTQLLHDNGIHTIAQLEKLDYRQLERIKGIGPVQADNILDVTAKIRKSLEENTAIRIDTDKKTGVMDAFVNLLYCAGNVSRISRAAKKLFDDNNKKVKTLRKKSMPARHWFVWALSSEKTRQTALESMRELEELASGSYKSQIDELTRQRQEALQAKHDEYWNDFKLNSAGYYVLLENIMKSDGGSKNAGNKEQSELIAIKNGLSEELAVAIGNVPLDLTGMKHDLRSYQRYGVQYIINQGAVLLGDDMGLGKTVQAIGAMVALGNTGIKYFFVICPASVLVNWIREIQKFCDLKVFKIHGKGANTEYSEWMKYGGVGVTTYEMLAKLSLPEDFKIDFIVADEAHYVKNPEAARTVNLLMFRQHTDRVLFMTGTPIENNVEEMCFLIGCLQPSVAKSVMGSTSLTMASDFRRKVATVYFRRVKEDVLTELPEKTESEEWCTLTEAEANLYKTAVMYGDFAKMRQASWLVEKYPDSSKGVRLYQLIKEAREAGRKVIVFSMFLHTLDIVSKMLNGKGFGPITGSLSPDKRQAVIDDFTAAEDGAVLISQIQAGGTGLNIQAASVIIFCEPQLKPSIENQAIGRAYRMGQTNRVLVYRLLNEKTVDEKIMDLLKSKQTLFDNFADISESGKESLAQNSELGDNDIKAMIEAEQKQCLDDNTIT